jgi:hypothetical protein
VWAIGEGQVLGACAAVTMYMAASTVINSYAHTTSGVVLPGSSGLPMLSVHRVG